MINSNSKFYIESIQDTSNWIVQYTYNRHFQFQIENNYEISLVCRYIISKQSKPQKISMLFAIQNSWDRFIYHKPITYSWEICIKLVCLSKIRDLMDVEIYFHFKWKLYLCFIEYLSLESIFERMLIAYRYPFKYVAWNKFAQLILFEKIS